MKTVEEDMDISDNDEETIVFSNAHYENDSELYRDSGRDSPCCDKRNPYVNVNWTNNSCNNCYKKQLTPMSSPRTNAEFSSLSYNDQSKVSNITMPQDSADTYSRRQIRERLSIGSHRDFSSRRRQISENTTISSHGDAYSKRQISQSPTSSTHGDSSNRRQISQSTQGESFSRRQISQSPKISTHGEFSSRRQSESPTISTHRASTSRQQIRSSSTSSAQSSPNENSAAALNFTKKEPIPSISRSRFFNIKLDISFLDPSKEGLTNIWPGPFHESDCYWDIDTNVLNTDEKKSPFYERLDRIRIKPMREETFEENLDSLLKNARNKEKSSSNSLMPQFYDKYKDSRCSHYLNDIPCSPHCSRRHVYPKDDEIHCKYYYLFRKCFRDCKYVHKQRSSMQKMKLYEDKYAKDRCSKYLRSKPCSDSCGQVHRLPKMDDIWCFDNLSLECTHGSECIYKHDEDSNMSLSDTSKYNLDEGVISEPVAEVEVNLNNNYESDVDSVADGPEHYFPSDSEENQYPPYCGVGELVDALGLSESSSLTTASSGDIDASSAGSSRLLIHSSRQAAADSKTHSDNHSSSVNKKSEVCNQEPVNERPVIRVKKDINLFDININDNSELTLGISKESLKENITSKYSNDNSNNSTSVTAPSVNSTSNDGTSPPDKSCPNNNKSNECPNLIQEGKDPPDIECIKVKMEIPVYDLSSDDEEGPSKSPEISLCNENLIYNLKREARENASDSSSNTQTLVENQNSCEFEKRPVSLPEGDLLGNICKSLNTETKKEANNSEERNISIQSMNIKVESEELSFGGEKEATDINTSSLNNSIKCEIDRLYFPAEITVKRELESSEVPNNNNNNNSIRSLDSLKDSPGKLKLTSSNLKDQDTEKSSSTSFSNCKRKEQEVNKLLEDYDVSKLKQTTSSKNTSRSQVLSGSKVLVEGVNHNTSLNYASSPRSESSKPFNKSKTLESLPNKELLLMKKKSNSETAPTCIKNVSVTGNGHKTSLRDPSSPQSDSSKSKKSEKIGSSSGNKEFLQTKKNSNSGATHSVPSKLLPIEKKNNKTSPHISSTSKHSKDLKSFSHKDKESLPIKKKGNSETTPTHKKSNAETTTHKSSNAETTTHKSSNAETTPNHKKRNAETTSAYKKINAEITTHKKSNAETTPTHKKSNAEATPTHSSSVSKHNAIIDKDSKHSDPTKLKKIKSSESQKITNKKPTVSKFMDRSSEEKISKSISYDLPSNIKLKKCYVYLKDIMKRKKYIIKYNLHKLSIKERHRSSSNSSKHSGNDDHHNISENSKLSNKEKYHSVGKSSKISNKDIVDGVNKSSKLFSNEKRIKSKSPPFSNESKGPELSSKNKCQGPELSSKNKCQGPELSSKNKCHSTSNISKVSIEEKPRSSNKENHQISNKTPKPSSKGQCNSDNKSPKTSSSTTSLYRSIGDIVSADKNKECSSPGSKSRHSSCSSQSSKSRSSPVNNSYKTHKDKERDKDNKIRKLNPECKKQLTKSFENSHSKTELKDTSKVKDIHNTKHQKHEGESKKKVSSSHSSKTADSSDKTSSKTLPLKDKLGNIIASSPIVSKPSTSSREEKKSFKSTHGGTPEGKGLIKDKHTKDNVGTKVHSYNNDIMTSGKRPNDEAVSSESSYKKMKSDLIKKSINNPNTSTPKNIDERSDHSNTEGEKHYKKLKNSDCSSINKSSKTRKRLIIESSEDSDNEEGENRHKKLKICKSDTNKLNKRFNRLFSESEDSDDSRESSFSLDATKKSKGDSQTSSSYDQPVVPAQVSSSEKDSPSHGSVNTNCQQLKDKKEFSSSEKKSSRETPDHSLSKGLVIKHQIIKQKPCPKSKKHVKESGILLLAKKAIVTTSDDENKANNEPKKASDKIDKENSLNNTEELSHVMQTYILKCAKELLEKFDKDGEKDVPKAIILLCKECELENIIEDESMFSLDRNLKQFWVFLSIRKNHLPLSYYYDAPYHLSAEEFLKTLKEETDKCKT